MLISRELLRQEWTTFRRPGRLLALAAAGLVVIVLGLLSASSSHSSCQGPCPGIPVAADGSFVSDTFYFWHRDLGPNGSVTVRLTSMTGTITYPPPDHDEIVSGLVPWAKAGIIVKDGVRQGSSYAALMMTGDHGVRMQHDYEHDIAGRTGKVSNAPRWLRLTRTGDTITGYESVDGKRWSTVGTAKLEGLPETAQVGLFANSPSDLTLRRVALGGAIEEARFTQATGVFDNVTVNGSGGDGGSRGGGWRGDAIGEMNHTDWEKLHNRSGVERTDGTIRISGTGDIGPIATEGVPAVGRGLSGLVVGLVFAAVIVIVVSARFGAAEPTPRIALPANALPARAIVLGTAVFGIGLIAVGGAVPAGNAILEGNGVTIAPVSMWTGLRVVVGLAAVLALSAVLAYALGALLRRGWAAVLVTVGVVVLPYAVSAFPLLSDVVAQWLMRLTPAAGFSVQQTLVAYPQVVEHYAPSAGYFPLPWWAGLGVLCAYVVLALVLATHRNRSLPGM